MSITTDIAGDYAHVEGVETVTLTPQNPVATAVTGIKAKRRALSRFEVSGGVVGIEPQDIPWHLWLGPSSSPATIPKNGDIITDSAGVVWQIMSLSFSTMTSRWRAVCRRQV